jgi:malto-oligosyltrehalose trehalohydrolase
MRVPDPASRFQPEGVHGPSEVIDLHAHEWRELHWRGRPWSEAVLYELHVGTFTPSGTFRAVMERLDHLEQLGVTAIEIMPIAAFPGARNWGYDGALLYAPQSTYGRPEDLKALVDSAHARGIMVILDVVYNHFGPEGNYLPLYAPEFFTDRHQTPWGAAVDYSRTEVREFVIENALYWIHEFRMDGLRLDAVHAILDDSPRHVLEEISERVHASSAGREVHLILENEHNEVWRLERIASGAVKDYTAQWNDDVHHVLHVAVTEESAGYYADYANDDAKLGRALAEGFAFQGETMKCTGRPRGEPSARLPPCAFVSFIQNHDQVGNRALGERLGMIADERALRAVAAIYLLLPQVPMLFMGEEWNADRPFPFFCDFSGDLGAAVTEGRRAEFAAFPEFQSLEMRERIPDPQAFETFESAKLDWTAVNRSPHREWLAWYRSIIRTRHSEIVPLMPRITAGGRWQLLGTHAVGVQWACGDCRLALVANLSRSTVSLGPAAGRTLWLDGAIAVDGLAEPWTVRWSLHQI